MIIIFLLKHIQADLLNREAYLKFSDPYLCFGKIRIPTSCNATAAVEPLPPSPLILRSSSLPWWSGFPWQIRVRWRLWGDKDCGRSSLLWWLLPVVVAGGSTRGVSRSLVGLWAMAEMGRNTQSCESHQDHTCGRKVRDTPAHRSVSAKCWQWLSTSAIKKTINYLRHLKCPLWILDM